MSATWNPEWNAFLGKEKDKALARRLGASKQTVESHRRRLGIPRYLVDRSGERHGRWVLIRKVQADTYEARCDCGRVVKVLLHNLASGRSTQCVRCGYASTVTIKPGTLRGNQEVVAVIGVGAHRRYRMRCGACGRVRKTTAPTRGQNCDDCKPGMVPDSHGERITINGETHNFAGWAQKLGISRQAVHIRIQRGWPLERALTAARGSAA